jgi:hypothetical protein
MTAEDEREARFVKLLLDREDEPIVDLALLNGTNPGVVGGLFTDLVRAGLDPELLLTYAGIAAAPEDER